MGILSLVLGVTAGTEVLEDDVRVVLDVVGGLLVASVLTIELDANEMGFHVAVWYPISETLLLLLTIAAASAASSTTSSQGACSAIAVVQGEVQGEGVTLRREVMPAADSFQAFFDRVPRISPLKQAILPGHDGFEGGFQQNFVLIVEARSDQELQEEEFVRELSVHSFHWSFRENLGDNPSHQHVEGKVFVLEMPIARYCRWQQFVRPSCLTKDDLGADLIVSRSKDLLHFRHVCGA